MHPCIWELLPLSLGLFVYLAAWCCADVPFFFNTLAPLPDVAAFGKTSMQAELCTEQCSAGVLPDDSQSVEMDWLKTQSVCRTSLHFGRRPLMASLPTSLPPSSSFFPPLLHGAGDCTGETKTQRKSVRPVFLQKLFHIFLILFLKPMLGSRHTMGGAWIKGIMLELSLLHT